MARCARCHREVLWVTLANERGAPIPLDYRPADDQDGDLFVIVSGDLAVCIPEVGRFEARQGGRRLYAPHTRWCKPERRTA